MEGDPVGTIRDQGHGLLTVGIEISELRWEGWAGES